MLLLFVPIISIVAIIPPVIRVTIIARINIVAGIHTAIIFLVDGLWRPASLALYTHHHEAGNYEDYAIKGLAENNQHYANQDQYVVNCLEIHYVHKRIQIMMSARKYNCL